jgi:anti-sigma regulatory factor (Ser/Thr protein kinase)
MTPDMELSLPARAENIALIRHAFGALGETLAVDEQLLSDVRLAVTEACSNVIVHAYADGATGPLEVLATLDGETLTVTVRDEGPGITPHPDSPGLGLGLPLIASLAESVQLGRDERERTEVRMTFSLSGPHNGASPGQHPPAGESSSSTPSSPSADKKIDPSPST